MQILQLKTTATSSIFASAVAPCTRRSAKSRRQGRPLCLNSNGARDNSQEILSLPSACMGIDTWYLRQKRGEVDMAQDSGQSGGMSVREAGRRGGERVKAKYGSEFYEEIGRKGGEATKSKYGPSFYEVIGQKGGQRPKRKAGS